MIDCSFDASNLFFANFSLTFNLNFHGLSTISDKPCFDWRVVTGKNVDYVKTRSNLCGKTFEQEKLEGLEVFKLIIIVLKGLFGKKLAFDIMLTCLEQKCSKKI